MLYQRQNMQYLSKNAGYGNTSLAFPFAVGNLVVFTKICSECWRGFMKREKIKTKDIKIFQPHSDSDGFGDL
jgi:hypothetical protein